MAFWFGMPMPFWFVLFGTLIVLFPWLEHLQPMSRKARHKRCLAHIEQMERELWPWLFDDLNGERNRTFGWRQGVPIPAEQLHRDHHDALHAMYLREDGTWAVPPGKALIVGEVNDVANINIRPGYTEHPPPRPNRPAPPDPTYR
jgi:hypothetical protein